MFKCGSAILVAALLVGCGAPAPRPNPAGTPSVGPPLAGAGAAGPAAAGTAPPASDAAPARGPGVYYIDPAQSELRLLVYRGGALARLGHNHVIVNRAVGGWIKFRGDPGAVSFAFKVPVEDFMVDNAGARSQEGTDFFEEVPDDAKTSTRRNMLSPALLDADRYPAITLTSVAVRQATGGSAAAATVTVNVAGHESTLVVPFEAATSAGQISVSGSAVLRQTALGLTPFSIMLGALQVQDELTVKFTLVALAT